MKKLIGSLTALIFVVGASAQTLEEKSRKHYAMSSSHEANEHYRKGNSLLDQHQYEAALAEFKMAVEKDHQFVLAIDNLAVCHRRLNQLDEAIHVYQQSLAIFPEGEFALTNVGILYVLKNQLDRALLNYSRITELYPHNPEGHFGLAEVSLLQGNHEDALHPICRAHKIYKDSNPDNLKDSEEIMRIIHTKMKEAGKEEIFMRAMHHHGIDFTPN
jgi:tetratricopeptide (TPR) repeat protein